MINFHEHKLWQQAYVALMDLHDVVSQGDVGDHDREVVKELVESAQKLTATIADSLTRQDRRVGRELMGEAVGQVAITRTHLAVAWGRGLMDDETFRPLDEKYASLSEGLQSSR